jgi:hypothetical protein
MEFQLEADTTESRFLGSDAAVTSGGIDSDCVRVFLAVRGGDLRELRSVPAVGRVDDVVERPLFREPPSSQDRLRCRKRLMTLHLVAEDTDVFVDGKPAGPESTAVIGRRSYIDDILFKKKVR